MSLKVRFEIHEHVLCISIGVTDEEWRFCPFHWGDSIIELVRALIAVMNDSPVARVLWKDYPQDAEFQFLATDNNMLFRIVEFENPARTQDKTVFEFSATPFELVIAFWRALRDLQGRYTEQEYLELQTVHWRTAFPTGDLEN